MQEPTFPAPLPESGDTDQKGKSETFIATAAASERSDSTEIGTTRKVAKKRRTWRKPKDKPKRPLSAYNLFFQSEREKMVHAENTSHNSESATNESLGNRSKIGFADLAKNIAQKWNSMDAKEREIYEARAKVEQQRYKNEIEQWQHNKEQRALMMMMSEDGGYGPTASYPMTYSMMQQQQQHQLPGSAQWNNTAMPQGALSVPTARLHQGDAHSFQGGIFESERHLNHCQLKQLPNQFPPEQVASGQVAAGFQSMLWNPQALQEHAMNFHAPAPTREFCLDQARERTTEQVGHFYEAVNDQVSFPVTSGEKPKEAVIGQGVGSNIHILASSLDEESIDFLSSL